MTRFKNTMNKTTDKCGAGYSCFESVWSEYVSNFEIYECFPKLFIKTEYTMGGTYSKKKMMRILLLHVRTYTRLIYFNRLMS